MPRPVLALLMALIAPLLAGCGGGRVQEANSYVDAINRAQSGFAADSQRLLRGVTPDLAPKRDQAMLRRFYATVDQFVARLRAIEPPAAVRALHRRLIATMQSFAASLRRAGAAIASRDATRILDGQARLARATSDVTREINATLSAINAALRR